MKTIDWNRYLGFWYEQCRVPSWFEPASLSDCTAFYELDNDKKTILITNQGINGLGFTQIAKGSAIIDSKTRNTLQVSFFPGVYAAYHILDFDENYQYAIVGSKEYIWLLTRTSSVDEFIWKHFFATAQHYGFDLNTIQKTPHRKPNASLVQKLF